MFKLKATLQVVEQIHCGYYSDPYNRTEKISQVKKILHVFPHQSSFNEVTNINPKNILNSIHQEILDFCRLNLEKSKPCNKGSGYCGCQTKYLVEKVKIIKVKEYS